MQAICRLVFFPQDVIETTVAVQQINTMQRAPVPQVFFDLFWPGWKSFRKTMVYLSFVKEKEAFSSTEVDSNLYLLSKTTAEWRNQQVASAAFHTWKMQLGTLKL